jgi:Skp family chaperone for outer membrane proteins
MVDDTEARDAVRQLMKRFDLINAQHLGLAYVLAERDAEEYARLLEAAGKAITTVIQPVADADVQRGQVYTALDDPNADWCKAVLSMLNQGPIILTRDQIMPRNERK